MDTTILAAAKEWGVPPWVVEDGPVYWFYRWLEESKLRTSLENREEYPDDDGD